MKEGHFLKNASSRIASLFSSKQDTAKTPSSHRKQSPCMQLNFFVLNELLSAAKKEECEKKNRSFTFFPLFTTEMLESTNPHLSAMISQARRCCSKQDLHLFPYKQFFLRNELLMRRVIEWRLSRYLKNPKQIEHFTAVLSKSSSEAFRGHLITLIRDEEPKETQNEKSVEKEHEQKWDLWKHHADGDPFRVSRT